MLQVLTRHQCIWTILLFKQLYTKGKHHFQDIFFINGVLLPTLYWCYGFTVHKWNVKQTIPPWCCLVFFWALIGRWGNVSGVNLGCRVATGSTKHSCIRPNMFTDISLTASVGALVITTRILTNKTYRTAISKIWFPHNSAWATIEIKVLTVDSVWVINHYLDVLLPSSFFRGSGLYLQQVTVHQRCVLHRGAVGAECHGQVEFRTLGHKGWSRARGVGVGIRKREWRWWGGTHAGGNRKFFFTFFLQLNFQL